MSKHTPAPWDIVRSIKEFVSKEQGGGKKITIHSGQGSNRKRIATITSLDNLSESEANARLIASAPELLDACKVALKSLTDYKKSEYSQSVLEQAIAKATGGEK